MAENAKYCILRWNKQEGNKAQFVVRDNKSGKQALFTPGRLADIAWVDKDLAAQNSDWEDFQEEPVENLSDVII